MIRLVKELLRRRTVTAAPPPEAEPVVVEATSVSEDDEVAPYGWALFDPNGKGPPFVIPADLKGHAIAAEVLDAAVVYDKDLVWHNESPWLLGLDTLRAVIQIAQTTEDPDIALIEVASHLLDWSHIDGVDEDD